MENNLNSWVFMNFLNNWNLMLAFGNVRFQYARFGHYRGGVFVGPSGVPALHGTKCPLLTPFFSLLSSLSLLLGLLFSQKGFS